MYDNKLHTQINYLVLHIWVMILFHTHSSAPTIKVQNNSYFCSSKEFILGQKEILMFKNEYSWSIRNTRGKKEILMVNKKYSRSKNEYSWSKNKYSWSKKKYSWSKKKYSWCKKN